MKLVICALFLCSSVEVHAETSKAKKPNENNAVGWKPYVCDFGIAEESVTVSFPSQPERDSDVDDVVEFRAYADSVSYWLEAESFDSYYWGPDDDFLDRREEYADEVEFKLDCLRSRIQWLLKTFEIVSYNIYVNNNGYPTLDVIERYKDSKFKCRIVVTEHGVYTLTSVHDVGVGGDQHNWFVDSLQITPIQGELP